MINIKFCELYPHGIGCGFISYVLNAIFSCHMCLVCLYYLVSTDHLCSSPFSLQQSGKSDGAISTMNLTQTEGLKYVLQF